jgi:hypothetical protein
LWRMLVLELWHRNFLESRTTRDELCPPSMTSTTRQRVASVPSAHTASSPSAVPR